MILCAGCKVEKPEADYSPSGLKRSRCRECVKKVNQTNYQKDIEARQAYNRQYRKDNKEKIDAQVREWRKNNPERVRELARESSRRYREAHPEETRTHNTYKSWVNRLRKYGLTPEEYWAELDAQDGKCAICRTDDPGKAGSTDKKTFAVDHCHARGGARGLLCHRCNRGLGMFSDDPEILERAASYLRGGLLADRSKTR